jgi:hypothetical protein
MQKSILTLSGIGLLLVTLTPTIVAAEAKIYPYPASANYCPAGLQPITISGVICCGSPNQSMTYHQAMAHPAPKRHVHRPARSARPTCLPGTKGCTEY